MATTSERRARSAPTAAGHAAFSKVRRWAGEAPKRWAARSEGVVRFIFMGLLRLYVILAVVRTP